MNKSKSLFLIAAAFVAMNASAQMWPMQGAAQNNAPVQQSSTLELWYDAPAKQWTSALPLGNGRLGAMVFGGVKTSEFQLNEETLWGGSPGNNNLDNFRNILPEVRQLIWDGKEREAERLLDQECNKNEDGMPFQTIGSLKLDLDYAGNPDEVKNYRRDLSLERAVATTTYTVGDVTYTQESFTSFTDDVVVIRISADKPSNVGFTAYFQSPLNEHKTVKAGKQLVLTGKGSDHEGVKGMVQLDCRMQVLNDGGRVALTDSTIVVTGSNSATIYVSAATNFVNYKDLSANPAKRSAAILAKAIKNDYAKALDAHTAQYKKYFDRVHLSLGRPNPRTMNLPTDQRLDRFTQTDDAGMAVLHFQYGRYLLICSSQPGGQPANLQGIWNNQLFAPWDGKYTININAEMNYWPAEPTNLTEMTEPLTQLIMDLSETGQSTAKEMYGARGWVAHHNTDIWRCTGPIDNAQFGVWPHGGAWLATHLWQHYLYTGDKDYLQKVYPAIKGAALFYVDNLVKHPQYGWLVTSPSLSPEHGPDGHGTIQAGSTMDNQIAFDALSQAELAARTLGVDAKFCDTLKNVIAQLPPMQIGKHNQLQEWLGDYDNPNDQHRHISHAYGLYPSNQVSPYTHPLLFQSLRNTMVQRGDQATGWSIGWKINLWARLLDGNHAYKIIRNMLVLLPDGNGWGGGNGRTYPNLFDAHPPFQIDGNFGYTAGIAEMLIQSYDGALHLLPALPDEWAEGEVDGLVARGAFVIDHMKWNGGQVLEATITSRLGGNLRLRSYTPLMLVKDGKKVALMTASGKNPNPLYPVAEIAEPRISAEISAQHPMIRKVYEYDIPTSAGEVIKIAR